MLCGRQGHGDRVDILIGKYGDWTVVCGWSPRRRFMVHMAIFVEEAPTSWQRLFSNLSFYDWILCLVVLVNNYPPWSLWQDKAWSGSVLWKTTLVYCQYISHIETNATITFISYWSQELAWSIFSIQTSQWNWSCLGLACQFSARFIG